MSKVQPKAKPIKRGRKPRNPRPMRSEAMVEAREKIFELYAGESLLDGLRRMGVDLSLLGDLHAKMHSPSSTTRRGGAPTHPRVNAVLREIVGQMKTALRSGLHVERGLALVLMLVEVRGVCLATWPGWGIDDAAMGPELLVQLTEKIRKRIRVRAD